MPNFPWLGRRDVSAISDASLSALLAGAELPAGSAPELRPVAEALAALTAPPASDELSGEAQALAVFRRRLGTPSPAHRARRRPAVLPAPLSSKVAAAVTVAALGIGGLATAAYAKALPAALQSFAHTTIGAPAARTAAPAATARTGRGPSPVGPRATGHAAYGLCTAWAHAKAHGTRKQKAVAFRNLAAAAGGAGKVAAYCATVPHPGASPSKKPHGNGKPTSHPTPHGNGKPTSHPTPHATGKP